MQRWVKAKSGRSHLDLGERSSQSLRVRAEHIIVTACRAHVDADCRETSSNDATLCSNCLRIYRTLPLATVGIDPVGANQLFVVLPLV
jgi:hypothetical protein